MTTTVVLPDDLLREIESLASREGSDLNKAITVLLRIGLARTNSSNSTPDQSMMEHRLALTQKFISGEWKVEFTGYKEALSMDRHKAEERANAWRE